MAPPATVAEFSRNTQFERLGSPPSQNSAPPLRFRAEFCLKVQFITRGLPRRLCIPLWIADWMVNPSSTAVASVSRLSTTYRLLSSRRDSYAGLPGCQLLLSFSFKSPLRMVSYCPTLRTLGSGAGTPAKPPLIATPFSSRNDTFGRPDGLISTPWPCAVATRASWSGLYRPCATRTSSPAWATANAFCRWTKASTHDKPLFAPVASSST